MRTDFSCILSNSSPEKKIDPESQRSKLENGSCSLIAQTSFHLLNPVALSKLPFVSSFLLLLSFPMQVSCPPLSR